LADSILGLSPFDRGRVFLTTGGSESVDSSMKIARIAQREAGRPEKTMIVSREHGYHGTNFGGTSAQGIAANREGFGELVGNVVNVEGPDIEPMARLFAEKGDEIAAVISEPLQGAGGVFPPPEGYLEGLRALCDQYDAFLILDEVITGFGRLGSWFGAQHYGVTPDMMTFAKASSSGYIPLGGVIVGPTVTDALTANEGFALKHGYTYSGHPIAAAAGSAAIAIQQDEGLLERVPMIERRLGDGLQALRGDGLVAEVRGTGAVWAVQLPDGRDVMKDRDAVLSEGVIVRPIGSSLVMCPPLVITESQIDRIVDALATVLSR
jgi:adenosylmethionine-8-amino-7-oxononanoate aminotransferase